MLPVVGRVVFGANHVVATPRLPTQGARNVPNPARRVVVIRSSGFGSAKPTEGIRVPRRVCCLGVRKSTSWNHVSASAVWGSTVANAKQPQPSWKRGNDTHRRHTRVVGATAANRFDAVAQTTPDSGVDERVPPLDQDEGVSQQTRTAYALIMVICVGATLLIAHFAAVPLPDLPRPETWALLHPTSVGFRGLQSDWGGFLRLCDYTGTALFAQSGVVAAGKKGMDFLGCLIVGCITAMGGGTFRGFVLGERPVFWAAEPEYLFISLAASVLTFFVWPGLERWLLGRGCTGNTENDAKKHTKNEANLEESETVLALTNDDEDNRRRVNRRVLRDRREQRFARRERKRAHRHRVRHVHGVVRGNHKRHVLRQTTPNSALVSRSVRQCYYDRRVCVY